MEPEHPEAPTPQFSAPPAPPNRGDPGRAYLAARCAPTDGPDGQGRGSQGKGGMVGHAPCTLSNRIARRSQGGTLRTGPLDFNQWGRE